ncbi:MAG: hypothetical protein FJW23_14020 [Acidimicrobiia bacterium]|nr:hypothetical protein [Acidimicrobiia bacterium]
MAAIEEVRAGSGTAGGPRPEMASTPPSPWSGGAGPATRPFGDAVAGLARLVRDLARGLGRQARLEVEGEDTAVARETLDRLAPLLGHLLRHAVDHGIEPPAQREAAGKPSQGLVTLRAERRGDALLVHVRDDGRGSPPGDGLSTLRTAVTEARGSIRVEAEPGHGTRVELTLPAVQPAPAPAGRDVP